MTELDKIFSIRILEQHWIDKDEECLDGPFSHGKFQLWIGGEEILNGVTDYTFCISATALALLRTLKELNRVNY